MSRTAYCGRRALIALAILLVACSPVPPAPAPTASRADLASQAITAAKVAAAPPAAAPLASDAPGLQLSPPAPPKPAPPTAVASKPQAAAPKAGTRQPATVVRVVDGDTVRLKIGHKEEPVRLIGVNTPESVDPRKPVECLGKEASAKAAQLLPVGTAVHIEDDPTQDTRDRFGRLLLYVWMPNGKSLSLEMIATGYAHEYTYERPYRYQAEHRAAQKAAEAGKVGLWAPGACETPAKLAAVPTAPKPTGATKPGGKAAPLNKDDCPPTHPIKGNQGSRSTDTWIYHPPGSGSYNVTDPEECFDTPAAAEAAGYRAPLR